MLEISLLSRERPFRVISHLAHIHWGLVFLILSLAGVGYVALVSAGGGSSIPFARPQIIRFGFGLVMMLGMAFVPPGLIMRFAWPFYIVSILLLAQVLLAGHVGKGARRWLVLGGMAMQPSELVKIALIVVLSSWFRKITWQKMRNPLTLLVPFILVAIPVLLVLKQPNLGTAIIIACLGGSLFVAAGMRLWPIILVIAIIFPFSGKLFSLFYQSLHGYQRTRIDTFLHPETDPLGAGYNIIQSKIGLGSGGMWGRGFLKGTQGQLSFLPEKQTDFIFTMIAEEWGYVGAMAVIILLFSIFMTGMIIAMRCQHQFGRLLALGISVNFFFYCVVNLSMVMGAIPVGGVPLPMISYGGSAMLTVMFGFGFLLSVSAYRKNPSEDMCSTRNRLL